MRKLIFNFLQDDSLNFVEVKSCSTSRAASTFNQAKCFFPGSFNPLHRGHIQMANVAAALLQLPVWFEISVTNVEKPTLGTEDILHRLDQDFGDSGVVLTKAKTFAEKSALFPKATFIVGVDTIFRTDQVRFYENDEHQQKVFLQFKERNIRFLVFGREMDGTFRSEDIPLSQDLKSHCRFIPQSEFDIPISSSEIRMNRDR